MVSLSDPFWQYNFDDAYFNSDNDDMDIGGCGNDLDSGLMVMTWILVTVMMT